VADIDAFVQAEADSLVAELSAWCAIPGEEGWSPLERIGGRPSADVNGVWGGYTGVGSKTVIPPLFERWVRIHAPNERLLLANYYRGVRAAAYTFEELARPEVVAALCAWRR
jgi:hypothetical protein